MRPLTAARFRGATFVVLLSTLLACDPEVSDAGDAATDPDGAVSEPDASAGDSCDRLSADWDAFLAANRACSTDAECVLWGTIDSCNCTGYYSGPDGPALNRRALPEAERRFPISAVRDCGRSFERRFLNSGICDAWWTNAVCRSGACRAVIPRDLGGSDQGCLPSAQPDAGPPDAGPPDAGVDAGG